MKIWQFFPLFVSFLFSLPCAAVTRFAYVGGEWDFILDDGPPLEGKDWQEGRLGIGVIDRNSYYFSFNYRLAGRTNRLDHILSVDGTTKIINPFWIRLNLGGSPDHDFSYQFRSDVEAEFHFENFIPGVGYWFVHYSSFDLHGATAFVRLYWKNAEIDLRYLNFYDTGAHKHFGSGQFRIENKWNEILHPVVGAAIGSRLFGILTLQASPGQDSFIVYAGNRFHIGKIWTLTPMVSHARESPAFQYWGLSMDLVMRW